MSLRSLKKRWLALALFLLTLLLVLWAMDRLTPLPLRQPQPARVVVAADGTPLWRFADCHGIWCYPVTPEEVSPAYLQALLTYKDRWFWYHPGINPLAVLRAAWQDLRHCSVISSGSTFTMQVARIIDPQPRTLKGKLIQAWYALQLEWHLSKRDILTLYLNRAPFGGMLEGFGAASWSWLSKALSQLTRGEAALPAVLPQAPSRLRPVNGQRPRATKCWTGWRTTVSGRLSRWPKSVRSRSGCHPGRCRHYWPGDCWRSVTLIRSFRPSTRRCSASWKVWH